MNTITVRTGRNIFVNKSCSLDWVFVDFFTVSVNEISNHFYIAFSLYMLFTFIAGLGLITAGIPIGSMFLYSVLYIGFLFMSFRGLGFPISTTWMLAVGMFALQYLATYIFPSLTGFSGYLLFVFLLGRFIGVKHPMAPDDRSLSTGRKVLGWICLIIFIICFSFEPLVME